MRSFDARGQLVSTQPNRTYLLMCSQAVGAQNDWGLTKTIILVKTRAVQSLDGHHRESSRERRLCAYPCSHCLVFASWVLSITSITIGLTPMNCYYVWVKQVLDMSVYMCYTYRQSAYMVYTCVYVYMYICVYKCCNRTKPKGLSGCEAHLKAKVKDRIARIILNISGCY